MIHFNISNISSFVALLRVGAHIFNSAMTTKEHKIAFFIARHSRSGVPLAQIRLAKALQRRGYSVDFIIGHVPDDLVVPSVDGINFIALGKRRAIGMFLPVLRYLSKNRPHIVFSAEDHLNMIVTMAARISRSTAKLSVSSRVTPFDTYSDRPLTKRWVMKVIAKPIMRYVDAFTCVSKDMVKQYEEIFGPGPYRCIYNVVCDEDSNKKIGEPLDDETWLDSRTVPVVISAGRLAPEKGFSDLIRAIALVKEHRDVRLLILGEGPLRDELQSLIDESGLGECAKLIGFRENPHKYFSRADVFVLSSYVEGLPNVLVEAIESGCTPVATDCPTGPAEVLQNGRLGALIPVHDPAAMAAAILKALDCPMSPEARSQAIAPFREDVVINQHKQVLGF